MFKIIFYISKFLTIPREHGLYQIALFLYIHLRCIICILIGDYYKLSSKIQTTIMLHIFKHILQYLYIMLLIYMIKQVRQKIFQNWQLKNLLYGNKVLRNANYFSPTLLYQVISSSTVLPPLCQH